MVRKPKPPKRVRCLPPCLPDKADNYLFEPDWKELEFLANEKTIIERKRQNRIAKLRRLDASYEAAELEYLRRKCAALQTIVDLDREWLAKHADPSN
jgi:hypothetical protein